MSKLSKSQLAKAIVRFAQKNSFVINPAIGYDYFVKNWMILGACACAPERKHCPCPESVNEVPEKGRCKCGLYWKNLDCWLAYDPTKPDKNIMQEGENGN